MENLKNTIKPWVKSQGASGIADIDAIGKYTLPVACWPDTTKYALFDTPNTVIIAVTDAADLQRWQLLHDIQPVESWVCTRLSREGIRLAPYKPKPRKKPKHREPGLKERRRRLPDLRLEGPVDFDRVISLREQEYSVPAIARAYGVQVGWLYYQLNKRKKSVDKQSQVV